MEEDEYICEETCGEPQEEVAYSISSSTIVGPEYWHAAAPDVGYREESYPWERSTPNGTVYLVNERFLIKHYDAAGFRVTADQEVELLVRNEAANRLNWVNITNLPAAPKFK